MHSDSSLAIGWILFLEKVSLNMRWDGTAGGERRGGQFQGRADFSVHTK